MAEEQERALAEQQGAPASQEATFTISDLMYSKPTDYLPFSVYDHEETSRFGIMRDEMTARRRGEKEKQWQARCEEAREWNSRRAVGMHKVLIEKMTVRFGADNEAVRLYKSMYLGALSYHGLPSPESLKQLPESHQAVPEG